MEQLLQLDTDILLAINGFHNDLLDTFFFNVSSKFIWIPMYAIMLFMLAKRYGRHSIWIILALVLTFALLDSTCNIIKNTVCRLRPSHDEILGSIVHIVNNYRSGRYGFPSAHAANTFGIALLFSLIWRDWRITTTLFIWTILNCLSRIYLAVHYPSDVFVGIILATIVAILFYFILLKFKLIDKNTAQHSQPIWQVYVLPIMFCLTSVACFLV